MDYSRLLLLSIVDSLPVSCIKRIDTNFLGDPVPSVFIIILKTETAVFSETVVLSAKLHGVTSHDITNLLEFLPSIERFSKHIKVLAVTRLAVRVQVNQCFRL